ncbi:MAG: hypothetical protein P8Z75_02005 [Gammaproteobacteria bacterium]|jgi:hypothetical protein
MKKTLADLLRLFILVNLIALAFHLLPNAAPARQQVEAANPDKQNNTLLVKHSETTRCQKPSHRLPFQPDYQATAYHLPR